MIGRFFELMGIDPDGMVVDCPEIELLKGLAGRSELLFNIPLNKLDYSIYLGNPDIVDSAKMLEKIDIMDKLEIINKQFSEDGNSELISITNTGYRILRIYANMKSSLKAEVTDDDYLETEEDRFFNKRRRNLIIEEKEDFQYEDYIKLHSAIENFDMDLVKQLVEAGADVNFVRREDEATPLSLALLTLDVDLMKYLISNGADLENKNKLGRTLLNKICSDDEIRDKLGNRKVGNYKMDGRVHELYIDMDSDVRLIKLNTLLEFGADINTLDNNRMSPLCNAFVEEDNFSIIKSLIEHGAKLDKELYYGLLKVEDFSPEYKTLLYANEKLLLK